MAETIKLKNIGTIEMKYPKLFVNLPSIIGGPNTNITVGESDDIIYTAYMNGTCSHAKRIEYDKRNNSLLVTVSVKNK